MAGVLVFLNYSLLKEQNKVNTNIGLINGYDEANFTIAN